MAAIAEIKSVECNNCNRHYPILYGELEPNINGEYIQGIDCDCTILNEGVIGHYGSCIDDVRNVNWVNEKPAHLIVGKQLCNKCINLFFQKKILFLHDQRYMKKSALSDCGCLLCLRELEERY